MLARSIRWCSKPSRPTAGIAPRNAGPTEALTRRLAADHLQGDTVGLDRTRTSAGRSFIASHRNCPERQPSFRVNSTFRFLPPDPPWVFRRTKIRVRCRERPMVLLTHGFIDPWFYWPMDLLLFAPFCR